MLDHSRDKNEGTHGLVWEGAGRAPLVTPDLSYYWEGG